MHKTYLTADDFELVKVQAGKEVSEDGYPCFYECEVTGTDAAGNEVDLPQTGNNDWTNWMTVFGAFCMIGAGWYCFHRVGIRLHKNKQ